MVRFTSWLCRVPVIKFKKGGISKPGGAASPTAAAPSPAAAPRAPGQGSCVMGPAQRSQPMSTGPSIPDIDLPARYRRQPLTDEEIAYINGGGVV